MDKLTLGKCLRHFKKIIIHKYWVFYYCCFARLYWRGIKHDLSKFSPVEFFESARYYKGDSSPIEEIKRQWGYSRAWLHHRSRNSHHYEMWTDNYDLGVTTIRMPYSDALELICDFLGAGRAYYGKSFTMKKELEYWENRKKTFPNMKIHPDTKDFIDKMLNRLYEDGTAYCLETSVSYSIYLDCLNHNVVV